MAFCSPTVGVLIVLQMTVAHVCHAHAHEKNYGDMHVYSDRSIEWPIADDIVRSWPSPAIHTISTILKSDGSFCDNRQDLFGA